METKDGNGIGRREFIGAAAAALFAGVVIQITGCSTESDSGDSGGGGIGDIAGSIAGNHAAAHAAVVTKMQVDAGGAVSLEILGASNHTHTVELTASDMAALKAKQRVMKTSTSAAADSHTHVVTFL